MLQFFHWPLRSGDRSLLVDIFLYEGRVAEAWRDAKAGGARSLWLRLAEARAAGYPEDSIPIYLRLAEVGIADAPGHRYDDAAKLVERAAKLHRALGRRDEFRGYLDALRAKQKAKRNLQKQVEERAKGHSIRSSRAVFQRVSSGGGSAA